jgi:hypothetical protein
LRLENGDHPAEIEGILLDLSDSGMDVLAAQSLYPGASLHARFTLPDSPSEFEVTGDVAWANPNGESGVRFTGTPDSLRAALRTWLRENSQATPALAPEAVADYKLTDLSLGGCYIETASPFPERTQVALTLRAEGLQLQGQGLVRVMHPSRGMGIELAKDAPEQRIRIEKFIQFLASHPGVEPQSLVSLYSAETEQDAYGGHNDSIEDPLLDLLRNHESFSEEMFLEALRGLRSAEFVQK